MTRRIYKLSLAFAALAVLCLSALTPVRAQGYEFAFQFGGLGTGNGQFNAPQGVALDSFGNIFVADTNNARIQKFNSSGVYQSQFNIGNFVAETLDIDASNNIFVGAEGATGAHIQKFNSSGVFQFQFGSEGSGNGQFTLPAGMAFDSAGSIFVADYGNARVQKFNSSGVYQSQFGSLGTGNGQFDRLTGITTDLFGNIYVADTRNHRIQKFNSSGVFLSTFGSLGIGNGQFNAPTGVVLDASGDIFVTDAENHRIQKFDNNGVYLAQFGMFGSGAGQFNLPYDLDVDPLGNVYAADARNHRIQVFRPTVAAVPEASTTASLGALLGLGILGLARARPFRRHKA